jgi:hypothetical protein
MDGLLNHKELGYLLRGLGLILTTGTVPTPFLLQDCAAAVEQCISQLGEIERLNAQLRVAVQIAKERSLLAARVTAYECGPSEN